MRLKLLTSDVDDLVDPDSDAIGRALLELIESSGDKPPRAVLLHGNGEDFIQFVAAIKTGNAPNCHVQYCERSKEPPGFRQYSSGGKTIEQVICLFQGYADGDEDWGGEFKWEPYFAKEVKPDLFWPIVLTISGLVFLASPDLSNVLGIIYLLVAVAIVMVLPKFLTEGTPGTPWTESTGRSSSSSGGGCGGCGGCGG